MSTEYSSISTTIMVKKLFSACFFILISLSRRSDPPNSFLPVEVGLRCLRVTTHIVATLLSKESNSIRWDLVMTKAASGLLDAFRGSAVYWGAGSTTNSSKVFRPLSENGSEEETLLFLQIRFQLYKDDKQKNIVYTLGLEQPRFRDREPPFKLGGDSSLLGPPLVLRVREIGFAIGTESFVQLGLPLLFPCSFPYLT